MRKVLIALAAAVLALGSAQADWRPGPAPEPTRHRPYPPVYYPPWPGWPGDPGPIYPPPRVRPPAVQIRYAVHYRPAPLARWRVYGSYRSYARAATVARRLEARGYETEIVVKYGRGR